MSRYSASDWAVLVAALVSCSQSGGQDPLVVMRHLLKDKILKLHIAYLFKPLFYKYIHKYELIFQ